MRKILITAAAGAALAVAPLAIAAKPASKPDHPSQSQKGKGGKAKGRCKTHNVGFNATGTLDVVPTLTQTQGTSTPTDTSDDRYSGTISVTVTKANHGWAKGSQTFTLTDAKVNDPTLATVGAIVRIHGKVTKQAKKCTGFTPTIKSIRSVSFTAPTA